MASKARPISPRPATPRVTRKAAIPAAIRRERTAVTRGAKAAAVVQLEAVKDMSMVTGTSKELASRIQALMAGASPDEQDALLLALGQKPTRHSDGVDFDLALASGWRDGSYPYQHLLSRGAYEKQKYRLQVELLKLQAWVKQTGQRVVILFEGRDAAGKGGTI